MDHEYDHQKYVESFEGKAIELGLPDMVTIKSTAREGAVYSTYSSLTFGDSDIINIARAKIALKSYGFDFGKWEAEQNKERYQRGRER